MSRYFLQQDQWVITNNRTIRNLALLAKTGKHTDCVREFEWNIAYRIKAAPILQTSESNTFQKVREIFWV